MHDDRSWWDILLTWLIWIFMSLGYGLLIAGIGIEVIYWLDGRPTDSKPLWLAVSGLASVVIALTLAFTRRLDDISRRLDRLATKGDGSTE